MDKCGGSNDERGLEGGEVAGQCVVHDCRPEALPTIVWGMRLYIIRHADPDYPNHTITPRGHLEAAALAEHFAKDAGLTHLYSSPLPRAVHTAEYVEKATGLKMQVEPWTAEVHDWILDNPPAQYEMAWDIPGEELRGVTPPFSGQDWHGRKPFQNPKFALHFQRIQKHSDEFFARHGYRREGHSYRIEKPNRDRIALVCHAGFGLTWLSHLLHIPTPLVWSGFWMTPTGVTTVLFDERNAEVATPRCIHLNQNGHLTWAKLEHNPHGIKANFE